MFYIQCWYCWSYYAKLCTVGWPFIHKVGIYDLAFAHVMSHHLLTTNMTLEIRKKFPKQRELSICVYRIQG